MMPPVIINYNGLSERQKNCVHHVHMPVIITICPKIAGAKAWEPPAARFRSVFDTISPLDIKHPQSMGEHFLRPVGCCRFLGLLTTDTTRTNKLPILSGVFAEAYTVLAIIVFYHCFSLSPRVKVCTGGNATDLSSLDGAIKRAYLALRYSGDGKDVCNYKQCAERVIYETMTPDQRRLYLSFMLDGVKDKTVFIDEDLTATARALTENSLSLTATAKQLFVHRNTLTHRIDKIYEDCGLDLRRFDDAKIFLAIAEIYAIALRNGEIK